MVVPEAFALHTIKLHSNDKLSYSNVIKYVLSYLLARPHWNCTQIQYAWLLQKHKESDNTDQDIPTTNHYVIEYLQYVKEFCTYIFDSMLPMIWRWPDG